MLACCFAPCQQSNETTTVSENIRALQATKCCINMLDGFYYLGWR